MLDDDDDDHHHHQKTGQQQHWQIDIGLHFDGIVGIQQLAVVAGSSKCERERNTVR